MIFLSDMKKNWCAFKIWLLKLLSRKMKLPTIKNEGHFIDPKQVTKVALIKAPNGRFYFHCFVNGEKTLLSYTSQLENWFKDSGLAFSVIEEDMSDDIEKTLKIDPQNAIFVDVENSPSKYVINSSNKLG